MSGEIKSFTKLPHFKAVGPEPTSVVLVFLLGGLLLGWQRLIGPC